MYNNMYNKPTKHREFLKLFSYTVMIVFLHSRREDKTCNAKRHQEFPEFELHLLLSQMGIWFIRVIPKYVKSVQSWNLYFYYSFVLNPS
jgi:hypothetical protein